ncbi:hypothetical protein Scuro_19 [Acinetobacter phage Scuro]|nr:hypothetical protein Scuro_19 [Acinetobacter phage Scuro]
MFSINDKDVKKLEKRLRLLNERGLPFATRETLNKMAFDSQKMGRQTITDRMVLRNKYTVQSVRVDQARGYNIPSQKAVMGSIADYMDEQEFGGVKSRKTGRTVGIPTSFSAGLSRGARPRTRLTRNSYKMNMISLRKGQKRGVNRRQQNAINIATSLGGFTYLDLGRRKGIFKIDRKGNPTMIHDLTRASVRIPQLKWMLPAVNSVVARRGEYYAKALQFQLGRL